MGIALRPFFALTTVVGMATAGYAQPSFKIIDSELGFPENTKPEFRSATASGLSADGTRLSANRTVYYDNPLRIDREAALISFANGMWTTTMLGGYPQRPESTDHASNTIGISGDGTRPYGPASHLEYNVNWPTLYSPVTALARPAPNSYLTITGLNHNGTIGLGYGDGSYHDDPFHEPRQYWWHRWTPSGVEYITPPTGNTGRGQPSAISADGSVFTGYSGFPGIPNWSAVRWTQATGAQPLPKPVNIKHAYGYGISANGQVIVGTANYFDDTFNNTRPCYWTPSKGFVLFDAPAPSDSRGELHESNHDGTVLGGIAYGVDFGGAMIYTPWSGPLLLLPYLEQSGLDLGDTKLNNVVGISADGKTIAGNCTIYTPAQSSGTQRPYVAKIDLPNGPTNLSLTRTSTTGGNSFLGTVTLHHAAAAPFTLNLDTSEPNLVQVPASVEVGANSSSAAFSVVTQGVAQNTVVSINARYNGVVLTRNVTLVPAVLANVAVNPTELFGTSRATGVVKLTGKVVADTEVTISDNTTAINTPASVIIPAGTTGVNFPITTTNVSTEVTRQTFATFNGVTKSASLKIKPYHAVQALTLTPSAVVGGNGGTGKVQLTLAAPAGGVVVNLASNSSSIQVPGSINIAAGQSSGTFAFTSSAVSATVTRNITATYGQAGRTAALTLSPAGLLSLSANPSSVKGGSSTTVTLTMDGPVAGSKTIALTDNSSVLTTPASVTVANGAKTATFTVGTTAVGTTVTRKVTATYNGASRSVFITVTP